MIYAILIMVISLVMAAELESYLFMAIAVVAYIAAEWKYWQLNERVKKLEEKANER